MTDSNQDQTRGGANASVVFAADFGGTHLRAATVDESERIHFRLKRNTARGETPDEIVRALVLAVRECETLCRRGRGHPDSIGRRSRIDKRRRRQNAATTLDCLAQRAWRLARTNYQFSRPPSRDQASGLL